MALPFSISDLCDTYGTLFGQVLAKAIDANFATVEAQIPSSGGYSPMLSFVEYMTGQYVLAVPEWIPPAGGSIIAPPYDHIVYVGASGFVDNLADGFIIPTADMIALANAAAVSANDAAASALAAFNFAATAQQVMGAKNDLANTWNGNYVYTNYHGIPVDVARPDGQSWLAPGLRVTFDPATNTVILYNAATGEQISKSDGSGPQLGPFHIRTGGKTPGGFNLGSPYYGNWLQVNADGTVVLGGYAMLDKPVYSFSDREISFHSLLAKTESDRQFATAIPCARPKRNYLNILIGMGQSFRMGVEAYPSIPATHDPPTPPAGGWHQWMAGLSTNQAGGAAPTTWVPVGDINGPGQLVPNPLVARTLLAADPAITRILTDAEEAALPPAGGSSVAPNQCNNRNVVFGYDLEVRWNRRAQTLGSGPNTGKKAPAMQCPDFMHMDCGNSGKPIEVFEKGTAGGPFTGGGAANQVEYFGQIPSAVDGAKTIQTTYGPFSTLGGVHVPVFIFDGMETNQQVGIPGGYGANNQYANDPDYCYAYLYRLLTDVNDYAISNKTDQTQLPFVGLWPPDGTYVANTTKRQAIDACQKLANSFSNVRIFGASYPGPDQNHPTWPSQMERGAKEAEVCDRAFFGEGWSHVKVFGPCPQRGNQILVRLIGNPTNSDGSLNPFQFSHYLWETFDQTYLVDWGLVVRDSTTDAIQPVVSVSQPAAASPYYNILLVTLGVTPSNLCDVSIGVDDNLTVPNHHGGSNISDSYISDSTFQYYFNNQPNMDPVMDTFSAPWSNGSPLNMKNFMVGVSRVPCIPSVG